MWWGKLGAGTGQRHTYTEGIAANEMQSPSLRSNILFILCQVNISHVELWVSVQMIKINVLCLFSNSLSILCRSLLITSDCSLPQHQPSPLWTPANRSKHFFSLFFFFLDHFYSKKKEGMWFIKAEKIKHQIMKRRVSLWRGGKEDGRQANIWARLLLRLMAANWSLWLWLTDADHPSAGPGFSTLLSTAGSVKARWDSQ